MIAALITVSIALAGYIATYLNGLRLTQRQERLARITRQLAEFYGPLLAMEEVGLLSYAAFSERHSRADGQSPFDHDGNPTDRELAEWRIWLSTVFIPNIKKMREIVVSKADLIIEAEMPPALIQLCAHAAGYEITAARWGEGDYRENFSAIPYPRLEITRYVRKSFRDLKREQNRLLGGRRH
ncbi:hypothetical protein [Streptomyces sp. NPDC005969]|uniref:hypothetical protein n=1 Tax=Streptomyces sp. NPDC005969 TaxID=3156722 RepID=UPI0033F1CD70